MQKVKPELLRTIIEAFHCQHQLKIIYCKLDGQLSTRIIDPLRIINYQSRWYLLAYCRLREKLRTFLVARIKKAEVLTCKSKSPQELNIDPETFLDLAFGIFKGEKTIQVKILFTGQAANIIKEQKWHKDQELDLTDEGVIMRLPVADFTELKMKVLQFGAEARVLEPPSLKQELAQEIRKMYEQIG